MVRVDLNPSDESADGWKKLVTMIAPVEGKRPVRPEKFETGFPSRKPATGSRSGSSPAAASEKEHPLHGLILYRARTGPQNLNQSGILT
jgi:hypothetical protein